MLAALQWTLIVGWVVGVLFALAFGRGSERWGAAICIIGVISTLFAQALSLRFIGDFYPTSAFALVYLLESLAFAFLALRDPDKLWPGVAGCFQFLVLIFNVSQQTNFPLPDQALVAFSNLSALGVSWTLALGTYLARWAPPKVDEWEELAATLDQLPPVRAA